MGQANYPRIYEYEEFDGSNVILVLAQKMDGELLSQPGGGFDVEFELLAAEDEDVHGCYVVCWDRLLLPPRRLPLQSVGSAQARFWDHHKQIWT